MGLTVLTVGCVLGGCGTDHPQAPPPGDRQEARSAPSSASATASGPSTRSDMYIHPTQDSKGSPTPRRAVEPYVDEGTRLVPRSRSANVAHFTLLRQGRIGKSLTVTRFPRGWHATFISDHSYD
jgi:hypothetical protein